MTITEPFTENPPGAPSKGMTHRIPGLEENMKKWTILVVIAALLLVAPEVAMAQDAGGNANDFKGLVGLGAGLAMGLAVLGGGLAQGMGVRAALEGIARNPNAADKIQTPMLLGLAFIESLVVFTFAVAYFLQGKI